MSTQRAGVLVVGGGIMGASIARAVAPLCDPLERPLVLLEKSGLAAGSTGRSGAILRCFYSDEALVRMAHDSLHEWSRFESTTGRSIGFERQGVLTIGGPGAAGTKELVERNAALLVRCGVEAQLLSAAEVRARFPAVAVAEGTWACWEPRGAGVDPVRACEAYAALAREEGAVTRLGVRVLRLVRSEGRITRVETDQGVWEADEVVIAAGPWSKPLLATAGVDIDLHVVRPEQYAIAQPQRSAPVDDESVTSIADVGLERWNRRAPMAYAAAHPVLLDLERGAYARCEGHAQRTRVGALDHARDQVVADPDHLDPQVPREFELWAREQLVGRVPEYATLQDQSSFVGLYTLSPDGQPLLGRVVGVSNLTIAVGFSGHGFKLAPSVGRGLAQVLAGEAVTAYDAAFFDPARFTQGTKKAGQFGL
jgi:glycine/D-amino acid oxidase-like deaminating enzyme